MSFGQLKPIVGGEQVVTHEYPFVVYLSIETKPNWHAVCGGTLVSPEHVITAGHCLYNAPSPSSIRVGYGDTAVKKQERTHAAEYFIHPDFDPRTLSNDIAVIRLAKPIQQTRTAHRIPVYFGGVEAGQLITAMGWGVTSNAPGAHTVQVMNRVDLHVADAKMCRRVDETFDSNNGPFICTGTQPGNKDECNGDSGSPAIITMVNGRPRTIQETAPGRLSRQQDLGPVADMRLIGLTSYGDNADHDPHPPCGDPSGFGFSTHIAYYTDFILQATGLTKDRLQEPIKFDRLAEAPKPSGGARAVDPMAGLHLWLIIALVASWLLRR